MKNLDLLTESYSYELDPSFIASRPAQRRDASKLMVYNSKTSEIIHTIFSEIDKFIEPGTLLVKNQSKVFPCRLFGEKSSGGKVELFLLSLIAIDGNYPAMIRSNGKKRIGDKFQFGDLEVEIKERGEEGDFLIKVNLAPDKFLDFLERNANVPIPPYIRDGIADEKDKDDYQTIFAKNMGSVAAPTAGLHFTQEVFGKLTKKGVDHASVTLHVGAGTFKTVQSENINDHIMHSENYTVSHDDLEKLNSSSKRIAVGTTTLRVLESSFDGSKFDIEADKLYSTNIFLHPGVEVNSIKGLITNFHLPKSTLLMLVSSLIGREKTLELYEIAKNKNYRFFSYGDAMLILR